jgi:thymidylate synthase (FAD)
MDLVHVKEVFDNVTYPKHPLLEHGYCQLIEPWGSDQRIIESARQSTDKGFLGWGPKCETCGDSVDAARARCSNPTPGVDVALGGHVFTKPGDEKLLAYLWKNQHSTPFEFGGLTIEVQAPIMVFREWHRHRVPFGYSELSARYAPMPNLNYVPTIDRLMSGAAKAGANKQAGVAQGAKELTESAATTWLFELERLYRNAEEVYQAGLAAGVPKELARLPVPVARFSRMRATGNLRGWLGFIKLRAPKTAQWEIRVYAEIVSQLIVQCFPRTAEVVELTGAAT